MIARIPSEERFWKRVVKTDSCWLWQGPGSCAGGKYYQMLWEHSPKMVTHVSWFLHHGAWPGGRITRTCGEGRCVHPDHMVCMTPENRFWRKVDKNGYNGCWLFKGALDQRGYGLFGVDGKTRRAHHVSLYYKNGRWPDVVKGVRAVSHLCHTNRCVNPDHLVVESYKKNTQRSVVAGKLRQDTRKREKQGVLNEDSVRWIMRNALRKTSKEMAERLGVDRTTVNLVVNGKTWQSVTGGDRRRYFPDGLCVANIRYVRNNPLGRTQTRLAEEIGIRQTQVSEIQRNKTYAEVV